MAEARRPMSFGDGLAYLLRFDVLSTNWRYVLSSFSPALIALGMYAAPIVADQSIRLAKSLGWIK